MKRFKIFRNKFKLTAVVFLVYVLFLDDVDIFHIVRQEIKLNKLQQEKAILLDKYIETKSILNQLDNTEALERYAREQKLFKRDNEDIFVIVEEGRE